MPVFTSDATFRSVGRIKYKNVPDSFTERERIKEKKLLLLSVKRYHP